MFIQRRQEEQAAAQSQGSQNSTESAVSTDQNTFHNWLVLARLITISEGAIEMKPGHFAKAVELD